MRIMEEPEIRILFERKADLGEPKRMEEVVVIEKRNDTPLGGSDAVRCFRSPTFLVR